MPPASRASLVEKGGEELEERVSESNNQRRLALSSAAPSSLASTSKLGSSKGSPSVPPSGKSSSVPPSSLAPNNFAPSKESSSCLEGGSDTDSSGYTDSGAYADEQVEENKDASFRKRSMGTPQVTFADTSRCYQCHQPFDADRKIAAGRKKKGSANSKKLLCRECFNEPFAQRGGDISRSYISDPERAGPDAKMRCLRQNDGHPTVRIYEEPAEGSLQVGTIPSGHCVRCTDDFGDYVKVHWRGLEGWVGRRNTVKWSGAGAGLAADAISEKFGNRLTVPGSAPRAPSIPAPGRSAEGSMKGSVMTQGRARSAKTSSIRPSATAPPSAASDRSSVAPSSAAGSMKGSDMTQGNARSAEPSSLQPPASHGDDRSSLVRSSAAGSVKSSIMAQGSAHPPKPVADRSILAPSSAAGSMKGSVMTQGNANFPKPAADCSSFALSSASHSMKDSVMTQGSAHSPKRAADRSSLAPSSVAGSMKGSVMTRGTAQPLKFAVDRNSLAPSSAAGSVKGSVMTQGNAHSPKPAADRSSLTPSSADGSMKGTVMTQGTAQSPKLAVDRSSLASSSAVGTTKDSVMTLGPFASLQPLVSHGDDRSCLEPSSIKGSVMAQGGANLARNDSKLAPATGAPPARVSKSSSGTSSAAKGSMQHRVRAESYTTPGFAETDSSTSSSAPPLPPPTAPPTNSVELTPALRQLQPKPSIVSDETTVSWQKWQSLGAGVSVRF